MYYKIEYGLGCGYKNVSLPSIYSSLYIFLLYIYLFMVFSSRLPVGGRFGKQYGLTLFPVGLWSRVFLYLPLSYL